ncbi:hypothetical protein SCUP515_05316 [Seiridium cupressi]
MKPESRLELLYEDPHVLLLWQVAFIPLRLLWLLIDSIVSPSIKSHNAALARRPPEHPPSFATSPWCPLYSSTGRLAAENRALRRELVAVPTEHIDTRTEIFKQQISSHITRIHMEGSAYDKAQTGEYVGTCLYSDCTNGPWTTQTVFNRDL